MPRRFPIFQFPNPPLLVAIVAGTVARAVERRCSRAALLVCHVALLVWGAEEVTSGANWFRRLLGVAGGGYALNELLRSADLRGEKASAP